LDAGAVVVADAEEAVDEGVAAVVDVEVVVEAFDETKACRVVAAAAVAWHRRRRSMHTMERNGS
jgi:hypothetical protein